MVAQLPTDVEQARLRALRVLDILDTPPEKVFDEIVNLTAQLLRAPIVLISLLDEHRQWFKSKVGLQVCETPREVSFCQHAIKGEDIFIVRDAASDARFKDNPLVLSEPHIRFYAGVPLLSKTRDALGTLCIIDTVPRELTVAEQDTLRILAQQVATQFELRLALKELARANNVREHIEPCLKAVKIGFWHWDLATGKLDWDENMLDLYGLDPTDFSAAIELWERCVHPADRESIDSFLRGVVRGQSTSFSTKFRIITPRGEERYIAAKGEVTRLGDGKAISVSGFNWDITEEEALRGQLTEFGDELRALFKGMREGLVVQKEGGTLIELNEAAARVLGVTAGQVPQQLIPSDWIAVREDGTILPAPDLPFAVALRTGEPQSGVVMGLQKPGGDVAWLLVNSVPLFRSQEPVPYRILTTFTDITQRKRLEDQLRESKRAEQQANERKSQFLANASHEIRTPLNGILGLSELLSETSLTEEQKDLNSSILDSGRSLLRIINDILDLSKIEAGKLSLSPRTLDLAGCVSRLVRPFEFTAKTKGISLSAIIDPVPSLVMCDDLRLGQILSNMIGNAIKFTERGGVSFRVQMLRSTASAHFVRFEVKDTGIGISYETAHRLFQPFTQGERVAGGTGLGLSIAQRLTELMGGVINFVSSPGQGATFWVDLGFPIAHREGASSALPDDSVVISLPRLAGAVLVAEDNLVNQKLIGRTLTKLGCTYRIVSNGVEALGALQSESYDLILMDCMMPVMDGYETTRRIRDGLIPQAVRTPIVALTANAIDGERERCLQCGMDGFIAKPVDRGELVANLLRYLKPADEGTQRQP